jgi:hypothetical protein
VRDRALASYGGARREQRKQRRVGASGEALVAADRDAWVDVSGKR